MDTKIKEIFYAAVLGLVAGLVAIFYRYLLSFVDPFLLFVSDLFRKDPLYIIFWIALIIVAALLVNYFLQKEKLIGGSGIPQVEAELSLMFRSKPLRVLVLKFVGGIVCAFSGLSLGREGPSVQLGAMVSSFINQKFNLTDDKLALILGSASGLSAAFSAPLAGVLFALEELQHNFNSKVLITALVASVSADALASIFFGFEPSFDFVVNRHMDLALFPYIILLGVLIGLLGVFYNTFILKTQRLFKRIKTKYSLLLAMFLALIFLYFFPYVLGGGHLALEFIDLDTSLSFIGVLLVLKLLFSFVSFGSGAIGGIFFPLLVIGALSGAFFSRFFIDLGLISATYYYHFVILAMAGFFSAIVRAPITGMILIFEMTGTLSNLLPLALVSLVAYIIAESLNCAPIYESLLANYQSEEERSLEVESLDLVVSFDSQVVNAKIKAIAWPKGAQITSILRHGEKVIASGDTLIKGGDTLIFDIKKSSYSLIKQELEKDFGLK